MQTHRVEECTTVRKEWANIERDELEIDIYEIFIDEFAYFSAIGMHINQSIT